MINKWVYLLLLSVGFAACKKDHPTAKSSTVNITTNGVYISNEGTFQFGNASVSYYNPNDNSIGEDIFKTVNNRPLGDICQSIYFIQNKAYVVVNNSNKIEVVNAQTFASEGTINGLVSPRYFLPVSNNKAYVTDYNANTIAIINLANNIITGQIQCPGWTEELCMSLGKVYVTNKKRKYLYIINPVSNKIQDSIFLNDGASCIKEDKNGKLWVLCGGDPSNNIKASLQVINPSTDLIETTYTFPNKADSPWRLKMNGNNDTLYFLNKGVFRMSINNNVLPTIAFIEEGLRNYYGLGVHPSNGDVYASDALDYVQKGIVYRYRSDGNFVTSFKGGISPGDFYFKN